MKRSIWIGYEPRETNAYLVAAASIRRYWPDAPIRPLILDRLREDGVYTRPMSRQNGQMFDVVSGAPMSTEFAVSRFFVPHLAGSGWALFMDCDMLIRTDLRNLFGLADPTKAVMCVQHEYRPAGTTKMDGQAQTDYRRKNWSSVVLFNCDHRANKNLGVDEINRLPGRDLHAFCWLDDDEIGTLDRTWNHLVDVYQAAPDAKIVHFTNGIPSMAGYGASEFSGEWRAVLDRELTRL